MIRSRIAEEGDNIDNSVDKESEQKRIKLEGSSEDDLITLDTLRKLCELNQQTIRESPRENTSSTNETNLLKQIVPKNYPSVLERYFKIMYCIEINDRPIDHQVVLFHSNRICLLSIAPNHPCLKLQTSIKRINCNVGKQNRWENKVSGKGKKGGQKLEPSTVLCSIETTDGLEYKFYSTVKGRLLEMNEALQTNPNLLLGWPKTKGHIAVVLSDLHTVDMHKQHMLEEDEYLNKVAD